MRSFQPARRPHRQSPPPPPDPGAFERDGSPAVLRRLLRRYRALVRATGAVAGIIAVLVGVIGIAPAAAESVTGGWRTSAGIAGTSFFVGQHRDSQGRIAYCTDFERLSPDRASGYSEGGGGPFVRSDGSTLSAEENAALAFVLGTWGATSDDGEAAAVQLAVWSLTAAGMGWDSPAMTDFLRTQALPAGVAPRARDMLEQARSDAGPYRIEASSESVDGTDRVTASLLSADGTPRSGYPMTAVLEGAVLADGSAGAQWTSDGTVHGLDLRRTGFGPAGATITAPSVPAPHASWLAPVEPEVQRLVVAPVSASVSTSLELAPPAAFSPMVTTTSSDARTTPGAPIHDALAVSVASTERWPADPVSGEPVTLEVMSTLWGPLPEAPVESASVPEGTPTVGQVTTTVSGPGDYRTPELAVPAAGYYVWTETIDPASARPAAATPLVTPWTGRFGLAPETTLVPWQPHITTMLSASSATIGDVVQDSVTATGLNPARRGDSIRLTMYGPLTGTPAESSDVPVGTPIHSELEVPAEDGTVMSADFAPLVDPGCYTVVARFDGSEDEEAFVSVFGIPAETVCVPAPPAPVAAVPTPAAAPSPAVADATPPRPQLAATGVDAGVVIGFALIAVGSGLGLRTLARRSAAIR